MPKLSELLDDDNKRRREVLATRTGDGLLAGALKWVFGWGFWNLLHGSFVWLALRCTGKLHADLTDGAARSEMQKVFDLYTLATSVALFAMYALWYTWYAPTLMWQLIAVPVLLFAFYRVVEMLQLDLWLHLRPREGGRPVLRPLVLALIAYGNMILAFAVAHLVASELNKDPYASTDHLPLDSGFVNALYFSVVTAATLGYGDFTPQKNLGKGLVMLEIAVSFLFVVVILQRAVSAAVEAERLADAPKTEITTNDGLTRG